MQFSSNIPDSALNAQIQVPQISQNSVSQKSSLFNQAQKGILTLDFSECIEEVFCNSLNSYCTNSFIPCLQKIIKEPHDHILELVQTMANSDSKEKEDYSFDKANEIRENIVKLEHSVKKMTKQIKDLSEMNKENKLAKPSKGFTILTQKIEELKANKLPDKEKLIHDLENIYGHIHIKDDLIKKEIMKFQDAIYNQLDKEIEKLKNSTFNENYDANIKRVDMKIQTLEKELESWLANNLPKKDKKPEDDLGNNEKIPEKKNNELNENPNVSNEAKTKFKKGRAKSKGEVKRNDFEKKSRNHPKNNKRGRKSKVEK